MCNRPRRRAPTSDFGLWDSLPFVVTPSFGIPKFLALIEPYRDIWPSLAVRYSALQKGGRWYNFVTSAVFQATPSQSSAHKFIVDDPLFRVGEASIGEDQIISFILSLSKPEVDVGPTRMRLLAPISTKPISFEDESLGPYRWTTYQRNKTGEFTLVGSIGGHQYIMLSGSADSTITQFTQGGEWDEIHRLLGEASFLELAEFGRDFLGWVFDLSQNSTPGVQVLAPLFSSITDPVIKEPGNLEVAVTGPPRSRVRDYSLTAVRRREDGEPIRGPVDLVEAGPDKPEGFRTYTAAVDTTGIYELDLQLKFRRNVVDSNTTFFWTKESGNANYRVFESLDDAETRLEKILTGKENRLGENNTFDVAVSWVLQLCGFEVMLTDLGPMKAVLKAQDAVDLIAMHGPSRKALVVDTTIGSIDENHKLSKVARRAAKVRGAAPDYDVLPVVVNLDRSFDPQEGATAKTYGISVVGLHELAQLKWMAKQVTSPIDILEYLRKQIPS